MKPSRSAIGGPSGLPATLAGLAIVVGVMSAVTVEQPRRLPLPEPARTLLAEDFDIGPRDMRKIETGEIVVSTLKTRDPREVAAFGATRLALSKEAFFARYREIERFRQHEAVKALGRFSAPPCLEDVLGLQFEADALNDLRDCRPGHCKMKLPGPVIARLQRDVNWSGPGWRAEAEAILRQELVAMVATYTILGEPGLVEYADKEHPSSLAGEFRSIVANSPYLDRVSPELTRHLLRYPHASVPGIENFLYWSKDAFGLKPVVTVSHVSIHQPSRHPNVMIGASKQIYASHYFLASLSLTFAIDLPDPEGAHAIVLIYVNRTRADNLQGFMGGLRRAIVRGRTEDGVADTLKHLKRRLESEER